MYRKNPIYFARADALQGSLLDTLLYAKSQILFGVPRVYEKFEEKIRQGYLDGSHSEIEVSSYDEWNPDNILERGMKLLEFMEKRWDLKFEDEDCKIEMLFLECMFPEDKSNEE